MGAIHPLAGNTNNYFLRQLEQLPLISRYVKTRGWPYLIAWCHRVTGILLVIYVCLHVYTLSLLETPLADDDELLFLEWMQPRNKDVRLDAAGKSKRAHRNISNGLM